MKRILIILLLLLVSVPVVYAQTNEEICTEKGGFIVEETGECDIFAAYEIHIKYPLELAEYEFATEVIDDYISNTRENFIEAVFELPAVSVNQPWVLSVEQEVFENPPNIVGVRFFNYQYTGGANGNTTIDTFVFDTTTGDVLDLEEIFMDDVNPLEILPPIITAALEEQLGEDFIFPEGLDPIEANYQNFVLSNESLIFTFDEYQVAPGAAGTPSVSIPLIDLAGSIVPELLP